MSASVHRGPLSEVFADLSTNVDTLPREEARERLERFLDALEAGEIRAAVPDDSAPGGWRAEAWVKEGILAAFSLGRDMDWDGGRFAFRDRDLLRPIERVPEGVRIVPGGTAIRRGAHLAPGVVVVPPAYVNVGAFIDEGALVDSHALVGSCAQVGRRVHVSAAAQIGGVLEPVGAMPVIVEDDAFIGGGAGIYEGVILKRRAVLAAGVVLTGSSVVYDLVDEAILRADPRSGCPLVIPEGSVVVPGARAISGSFAAKHGLSIQTAVIIKRRDERTDTKTALESVLRERS
jgi:2,3,4,5-tetrahydropyridine-2-carboxylate N-succinyltransferase